ncbi:hypothetical protein [Conexibacter sp. DBS9H8]|uniref:hypothetical protein n=1 Tax=Conexibacter sp. DBS9H8 TaxID=2937801 RepID=UPI00200F3AA4|nr:hypothetical protein [Conexibacter sp. DBS9H8]
MSGRLRAAAVRVVGTIAVATAAVAMLAGCGATQHSARTPPISTLCVDVDLPLAGGDGASPAAGRAARGFLTGVEMQIPSAGLRIGAYRVRLCAVHDDAPVGDLASAEVITLAARHAAANVHTIAVIGELNATDAEIADVPLAAAGIPLITPSGPLASASAAGAAPAPSGAGGIAAAVPLSPHPTTFYLMPSVATQAAAVREVALLHDCRSTRRVHAGCTVSGVENPPLCTGLGSASPRLVRYCVLAGTGQLANWSTPALAYGESAGRLLVATLETAAGAGANIADRSVLVRRLLTSRLVQSPIGPVRFDARGGIVADEFAVFSVDDRGRSTLLQTFRTH